MVAVSCEMTLIHSEDSLYLAFPGHKTGTKHCPELRLKEKRPFFKSKEQNKEKTVVGQNHRKLPQG